jgi:iron(III) transport system ATP-binding protein
VTLLGPSGCGKTTTLRIVAGLEVPDEGDIFFGERAVVVSTRGLCLPPDKRNVGMVFQSYAIWPHMTWGRRSLLSKLTVPTPGNRRARAARLELVGMADSDRFGRSKRRAATTGGVRGRWSLNRVYCWMSRSATSTPSPRADAHPGEAAAKAAERRLLFIAHDQIEPLACRIASRHEFGVVQQQGDPRLLYEQPVKNLCATVGRTRCLRPVQSSSRRQMAIAWSARRIAALWLHLRSASIKQLNGIYHVRPRMSKSSRH